MTILTTIFCLLEHPAWQGNHGLVIKWTEKNRRQRVNRNEKNVSKNGIEQAAVLLTSGMKALAVRPKQLEQTRGSDPRKVALALAIKSKTTVSLTWIAESLCMGTASNVSQQIRRLKRGEIKLGKKEAQWLKSVNIVT